MINVLQNKLIEVIYLFQKLFTIDIAITRY